MELVYLLSQVATPLTRPIRPVYYVQRVRNWIIVNQRTVILRMLMMQPNVKLVTMDLDPIILQIMIICLLWEIVRARLLLI